MTEPHILVLLDTTPASEAALDSAARLARHRQLELIALFVEDQDLIALASHAFSREISALSGQSHPFDHETLLTRLAIQRRQIETCLNALDQQERLRWRLDVVTGPVTESIRQAALGAEWVVLGKSGWSASRGRRLGSTAMGLIGDSPTTVMLWEGRPLPGSSTVVALITDADSAAAILAVADTLATATDRALQLVFPPGLDPAVEQLILDARSGASTATTVEQLGSNPLSALVHILHAHPGAELVIGRTAAEALDCRLEDLLMLSEGPVVIVPTE